MQVEDNNVETVCSILIVDDEVALLSIYKKLLEEEGYHAWTASTRDSAIAWLEQNPPPTLLLLDSRMGGMSNEDFVEKVKAIQGGVLKTRIIGFSSFSHKSSFGKEMRDVLGEFMEKPDDINDFLESINKLCLRSNAGKRAQ